MNGDGQRSRRYRGAQPFADDALSHRTFFGRDRAVVALTDQILANRLVAVYAKSGIGKSSLINAGVVPRLREGAYQPLVVRVNDLELGPTEALIRGIRSEAKRQGVEFVDGDASSLWSLFKTIEFWRGDLLLTPILIIDQFEELFTLHDVVARDRFIEELGTLVRGVPLPTVSEAVPNAKAPPLHLVLSLREDFLGTLEDAADRIPQILDHRFRVAPLNQAEAVAAMIGPAALQDESLAGESFELHSQFIDAVLAYLTKHFEGSTFSPGQIEPFHLQLICQRVEEIVLSKAVGATKDRAFSLTDFGGVAALSETLKTFYSNAIDSVADRQQRRAARRLCETFLISPEGRRLSLDEYELMKQLDLPPSALKKLVNSRLLRVDRRSDRTYYELSHDALVEPILATRRIQANLMAWTQLIFGAVGGIVFTTFWALGLIYVLSSTAEDGIAGAFALSIVGGFAFGCYKVFNAGLRNYRRFNGHVQERRPSSVPRRRRERVKAWAALLISWGLLAPCGFAAIFWAVILVASALMNENEIPNGIKSWKSATILANFTQEAAWTSIEMLVVVLYGFVLSRWAIRLLVSPTVGRKDGFSLERWTGLFFCLAVLLLAAAALAVSFLVQCSVSDADPRPYWLHAIFMSPDAIDSCRKSTRWADALIWLQVIFAYCALGLGLESASAFWRRFRGGRLRPHRP